MIQEHTYLNEPMSGSFNDHQSAELVDLRAEVAGLKAVIEALKLDNKELTKSYYAVLKKLDKKA